MRTNKSHLVSQHMEGISAKALEQYQDIIREYIRGRHGIYALYKRERLYYVGLASNLRSRLKTHLRDRHKGLWDRFSVYLTIQDHHIKELESLVLRIVRPKGNVQRGRLSRSQDLKKQLTYELRKRRAEELQVLVGKRQKVVRQKSKKAKAARSDSEAVLAPYLDGKRIKLRKIYKGTTYRATVRKTGWIHYKGFLYSSPNGVAQEITGRPCNGWYFWRYERAPDDWVQLQELRR